MLNCFYIFQPASKSTIPTASSEGIVGLTFSPYRDNRTVTYSTNEVRFQQQSHNNILLNAYNRGNQVQNPETIGSPEDFLNMPRNAMNYSQVNRDGISRNDITIPTNSENSGNQRSKSRTFKLAMPSSHRSLALIRKNFMQTFRNIG